MKKGQDFILSFSWLATISYFVVLPIFNSNTLATLIWVPTVLLNLIFCVSKIQTIPVKTMVICAVLVLQMFFPVLFMGKKLETSYYTAMLCLINSLLSISCFSGITISRKTKEFIKKCIIFMALLFTFYSFTDIAHRVTIDGVATHNIYFVFNLGNSNAAGIFMFLIFSILFIFTFNAKTGMRKFSLIVLCVYTAYMIYKTGARSCMIAVAALILVGLLFGKKRINKLIIYAATLFPAAFVFILTGLYSNGYEDVEILGKSIYTGREVLFKQWIDGIDTFGKWIFGDFAEFGLNNAHNCVLAWLLSLGILGVILIYSVYYDMIFKINDISNKSAFRTICVACILCLFVESIAEASLFLGGFPGVTFVITIIALSNESTEGLENENISNKIDIIS